jgi:LacI family transcriptional regulator, gluconate utilization system Gnt-I transcriptional repressor
VPLGCGHSGGCVRVQPAEAVDSRDIDIAGWGDYDVGRQLTPSLTTVTPFSDEIGMGTIGALLDNTPAQSLIRTRFEITVRESA